MLYLEDYPSAIMAFTLLRACVTLGRCAIAVPFGGPKRV
jgi:hypothetical protein